jgi:hypothetical protein
MRNIMIYCFVFFSVLTSCKSSLFIIKTDVDKPIYVDFNMKSKGLITQKDSLFIKTSQSAPYSIKAKNDHFVGEIVYVKKPSEKFRYSPIKSSNALEYARKISNYEGSNISTYFVVFKLLEKDTPEIPLAKEFGHIKLTSNEKDVEIYLDGKLIGQISDLSFNKKIIAGDHQLMARKEFYMPITIKFKLNSQEVYGYNFELKPAKGWIEEQPGQASTVQARGNLTVVTEFSDYKVFIEGIEKVPPFELKNMPAGIYKLKIVNSEQQNELEVTVDEGKTRYVDLDITYPRKK